MITDKNLDQKRKLSIGFHGNGRVFFKTSDEWSDFKYEMPYWYLCKLASQTHFLKFKIIPGLRLL